MKNNRTQSFKNIIKKLYFFKTKKIKRSKDKEMLNKKNIQNKFKKQFYKIILIT